MIDAFRSIRRISSRVNVNAPLAVENDSTRDAVDAVFLSFSFFGIEDERVFLFFFFFFFCVSENFV